ncbi:MAG: hypothetical protein AB1813_11355 [Verrucomicrobiota bacterium]
MSRPASILGKKERKGGLYYLYPGMGRSNKRWRSQITRWSIIFGLISSALVAGVLWLLNSM